ncbi:hypothetical protein SISNIDRAFT_462200 [Sistotremastrum niveocremeum HHB9708]|uniref:MYND-type domain-containing protein n=1 Tax=Sistotremastrum niveocremeum HHB9708 TaxID=1314777 RepID=A0A164ZWD6_9AGAM|nr:hypothetical protein SISNIDRAFT_462200 [Sistotremastrum niveocremeum HHB9708]
MPIQRGSRYHSVTDVVDACTRSNDPGKAPWIIEEYLDIETGSRVGFKKVHAKYTKVMKTLQKLYSKNLENDVVIAGVMLVLRDIFADAVLRDKIYAEGWLPKIAGVIERRDHCRTSALRAMLRILMHKSPEIAETRLSYVLFESPLESEDTELIIKIMGNALTQTLAMSEARGVQLAATFNKLNVDLDKIRDLILDRIQACLSDKPYASKQASIRQELILIMALGHLSPDVALSTPRFIRCFVACLRTSSLHTRVLGMGALWQICVKKAGHPKHFEVTELFLALCHGFPPNLDALMESYGVQRCFGTISLESRIHFEALTREQADHLDFYKFGMAISGTILEVENSVFKSYFEPMCDEYPFATWPDALAHVAGVLRSRSEFDQADAVEIKYLMYSKRWDDAARLARSAARRSPKIGFWYYAMCIPNNTPECIRLAQTGLECPDLCPGMRYNLWYLASTRSWELALLNMLNTRSGEQAWKDGVAYLTICYDYLQRAVTESPPDSSGMVVLVNLLVLAHVLLHGPQLAPDLKESKVIIERACLIDDLDDFVRQKRGPNGPRMMKDILLQHFVPATTEWAEFIQCAGLPKWAEAEWESNVEDPVVEDISQTLNNMKLHSVESDRQRKTSKMFANAERTEEIHLYQCSWCKNPSAALRKCSLCSIACYCDTVCCIQFRNFTTLFAVRKNIGKNTSLSVNHPR